MRRPYRIAISKHHHDQVAKHLLPGDGLEAAAILLCSRSSANRLLVKYVVLVPHDVCKVRLPNQISWPGSAIESAIDIADSEHLSIILIHSHPGGMFDFSTEDNDSDLKIIPCLYQAISAEDIVHGSAIMTPDKAIRARIYNSDMSIDPVHFVVCSSDDIDIWAPSSNGTVQKIPIAFSSEMRQDLKRLTACIVGVSGTGSIVVEQLSRMGIGRLILIDFDRTEFKNLNRILNSTIDDAKAGCFKTEMLATKVLQHRNDIEISCINSTISCRDSIVAAGDADFLFCCVDSLEGRQICDQISTAFLQPLFDVGVTIPTRSSSCGEPVIADVLGRIDYIYPGSPTLLDRCVYSPESLRNEYLRQTAPEDFNNQVKEGYIKGIVDEAPSVITLNMKAASTCVMEFLARRYQFRHEPNALFNRVIFSVAESYEEHENLKNSELSPSEMMARGLEEPLLGMPCFQKLGSQEEAA